MQKSQPSPLTTLHTKETTVKGKGSTMPDYTASIETWIGTKTAFGRTFIVGGGTLFTERGTLFTGKNCPARHYSPGNIVRGDTKQGGPNSQRHRHICIFKPHPLLQLSMG